MSHPPSAERPNLGELREHRPIVCYLKSSNGEQRWVGCSCGANVEIRSGNPEWWNAHILPIIEQREREARAQGACDTSQLLFDVANAGLDEWSRKPLGLLDFIRRHNDDTHAELSKLK